MQLHFLNTQLAHEPGLRSSSLAKGGLVLLYLQSQLLREGPANYRTVAPRVVQGVDELSANAEFHVLTFRSGGGQCGTVLGAGKGRAAFQGSGTDDLTAGSTTRAHELREVRNLLDGDVHWLIDLHGVRMASLDALAA